MEEGAFAGLGWNDLGGFDNDRIFTFHETWGGEISVVELEG
jgi:hypothetical protein